MTTTTNFRPGPISPGLLLAPRQTDDDGWGRKCRTIPALRWYVYPANLETRATTGYPSTATTPTRREWKGHAEKSDVEG
jgi:hypothetical protein